MRMRFSLMPAIFLAAQWLAQAKTINGEKTWVPIEVTSVTLRVIYIVCWGCQRDDSGNTPQALYVQTI